MSKFILSVVAGGCIGLVLAGTVIFVFKKNPDILSGFFPNGTPHIVEQVKGKTKPLANQYAVAFPDTSIPKEGTVVYADLGAMTIVVYQDGTQSAEYPIRSIGREGTAWQTPVGSFDMNYKKENHFSSIGHVYMPWAMHFFGNYFIHGWPYYPDGSEVPRGYSGGCIRLETEDAKKLYDAVDRDTTLIVVNSKYQNHGGEQLAYEVAKAAPAVDSNYLIADLQSGEVIDAKGQDASVPAGSFEKIMTAIVSLESLNQYNNVSFGGKIMEIGDLLYPMLLRDSDEAQEKLREYKNTNQYFLDMNRRAETVGMNKTVYEKKNPEDMRSLSTLEDQFKLLHHISVYKPFLLGVLSLDEHDTKDESVAWKQAHPLQNEAWYRGGFASVDGSQMMTLVEAAGGRVLAIFAQGNGGVAQDTETLYQWLEQDVRLKE